MTMEGLILAVVGGITIFGVGYVLGFLRGYAERSHEPEDS